MNFSNARVLITGANRGLGQAMVNELLKTDLHTIYAGARDPSSIQPTDPRVKPVILDLEDADSLHKLVADIDRLDLLINNAGVLEFGDVLTATEDQIDRCMNVNVKGIWRTSQAFVSHLKQSESGAICNILSLLSLASMPGLAAYNLSKAAAWSATLSLRATLAQHKIAVHGVFPGAMNTDMIADVHINKIGPADAAREIVAGLTLGDEDIFPADIWRQVYADWRTDHKAVERQFALA